MALLAMSSEQALEKLDKVFDLKGMGIDIKNPSLESVSVHISYTENVYILPRYIPLENNDKN